MKSRKLIHLAALTLFAAVPIASASTKWYVDGKHGNDNNNCQSSTGLLGATGDSPTA